MIRPNYNAKGKVTSWGVRIHLGHGKRKWVGSFPTKTEAREAEARAMLADHKRTGTVRCEVLAEWFLARYAKRAKHSTFQQAQFALKGFERDFYGRSVESITTTEAEGWAAENNWRLRVVVTMLNEAVKKHDAVTANPFEGLTSRSSAGRRDIEPLRVEDVARLAEVAGDLGPMVTFAAYTGLRKGEVFGLEWRDVDLEAMRVQVRRAVYRGRLDVPKTGPRLSALLPEARDALLQTRTPREGPVFLNGKGNRWSGGALGYHWKSIKTAYGGPVTFHELRHFCAHHLWITLEMRDRVVAEQLGHSSPRLLQDLYGHWRSGALDEFDRVAGNVVSLEAVRNTGAENR